MSPRRSSTSQASAASPLTRTTADTHFFPGRLDVSVDTLRKSDWVPYRQLGKRSAVMLGHVRLLDGELASSSAKAVSWLRRELGAQGLLVTDDLCMAPAWARRGGMGETAVRSLAAGVDIVLVALEPRQVYGVLGALLEARRTGRLSPERLSTSSTRMDSALRPERVQRPHVRASTTHPAHLHVRRAGRGISRALHHPG
ncbi:MAG: hypothetical protein JRH20_03155 [Deltaproteobacteria bacterium]|nr:hypothetical protein [Deltaproteobacteria bacterium]